MSNMTLKGEFLLPMRFDCKLHNGEIVKGQNLWILYEWQKTICTQWFLLPDVKYDVNVKKINVKKINIPNKSTVWFWFRFGLYITNKKYFFAIYIYQQTKRTIYTFISLSPLTHRTLQVVGLNPYCFYLHHQKINLHFWFYIECTFCTQT